MTKLTIEVLKEIIGSYPENSDEIECVMASQLLAYEQAAEHPAARITWDGSEFSVSNVSEDFLYGGTAVYLEPVLPKQPIVLYMGRELISKEGLELIRDGVSEATKLEGACMASTILGGNHHAQPVSEPYKLKDAVADIRNSGVEIDADKIKAERDTLNSPVIPDGWKLVPEQATIAMLTLLGLTGSFDFMQQKYKNMLAAAPAQESE